MKVRKRILTSCCGVPRCHAHGVVLESSVLPRSAGRSQGAPWSSTPRCGKFESANPSVSAIAVRHQTPVQRRPVLAPPTSFLPQGNNANLVAQTEKDVKFASDSPPSAARRWIDVSGGVPKTAADGKCGTCVRLSSWRNPGHASTGLAPALRSSAMGDAARRFEKSTTDNDRSRGQSFHGTAVLPLRAPNSVARNSQKRPVLSDCLPRRKT